MTFLVMLGVLSGSDARVAHLVNCTKAADLCDVAPEPVAALADACCVEPPARSDVDLATICLSFDDCSCCEHAPAQHLGEGDARSLFEPPTLEFAWLLAASQAHLTLDPPTTPARAILPLDCPLPAAPLFLLLGHLLF